MAYLCSPNQPTSMMYISTHCFYASWRVEHFLLVTNAHDDFISIEGTAQVTIG